MSEPTVKRPPWRPPAHMRGWLLALTVPAAAVGLYALVMARADAGGEGPRPVKPVRVGVVEPGSISGPAVSRRFRGTVQARRSSDLAFERAGRVIEVTADVGDRVNAGTVLARLDEASIDAEAARAEAELAAVRAEYAEAKAGPRAQQIEAAAAEVARLRAQRDAAGDREERRRKLLDRGAGSTEQYRDERKLREQLDAAVSAAESRLDELNEGTRAEQLRAALARMEAAEAARRAVEVRRTDGVLTAPYNGVVTARTLDEGSVVESGTTALSVMETSPYEAAFGLPAEIAARLSVGDTVRVGLGTQGEQDAVPARVARLAPLVDRITRTREVVTEFESDDPAVVGRAASIWLEEDFGSGGFWVPTSALVRGSRGLWGVYGVPAGETVVVLYDAEVRRPAGDITLVDAPLPMDTRVIVSGVTRIGPGVVVEPVEE